MPLLNFEKAINNRLMLSFIDRNETLSQQLKHSKINVDSVKQELTDYKEKATRILQVRSKPFVDKAAIIHGQCWQTGRLQRR